MRILVEPALGVGDADQPQQLERARARLLPRSSSRWMSSGSMICRPIGSTGLSEVIGSWKIIEMSRPRISRISSSESVEQVAALEQDAAVRDAPRGLGEQAHDRERGYRLAAAGFADQRDDLAAIDAVADAVDRADDAARGHEVDVQVLHFEQRCARARARWLLGRSSFRQFEHAGVFSGPVQL